MEKLHSALKTKYVNRVISPNWRLERNEGGGGGVLKRIEETFNENLATLFEKNAPKKLKQSQHSRV